jgi:hypothetical protein
MKYSVAALLVALCSLSSGALAASCLSYDTPATLSGKVIIKTFFGPPNYGENPETDSRESQGILVAANPICVSESKEYDAEKNQFQITLVPPRGVNLQTFAGKRVTVQGTLFHADNAHHHTTILMEVRRIDAVRN